MKQKYDPQTVEKKWQKFWKDKQTFKAEIDPTKPKYYVLDMFPYPSGAGLHVGHVTGYTGTDIMARYKRQRGFNVLHPMGWDSFGLPAEQYAIRTGIHPAITTKTNIDTYRRQLQSLGFSYDWSREFATSDPSYYRWTQWIFTKLFEKGLAYEAEMNVNFCPALGTVLANEEVENGKSKEGGYPVERRPLKQWILKITAYADRLLADLDLLDWPDHLKKSQINWIGKSEGALIHFDGIEVFTTRPDTLPAVTFLVLAPEHPAVDSFTTPNLREKVEQYKQKAASKNDLDRTDLAKEKTGVWTGSYVQNPYNQQKVPVWVADYVLMGYGTGAIMGVPSGDERDREFAEQYKLSILETEFLPKEEALHWIEHHGKGKRTIQYKLRDWLFSRQRYWGEPIPILHFEDGTMRALEADELPLLPPPLEDYKPASTGESPLAKVKEWVEITDPKTGKKAIRATNTMPQWAGSCWYYLRFCDPQNQTQAWSPEAERYWLPVDLYVGGVEHAVLHLLYARFWHKVLYDLGLVQTLEPFAMLRNQGLVTARSYKLPQGGYVEPGEVIEKEGSFFARGQELQVQYEKMSKSKLNGVSPDDMIQEFGADALRLYEMFMGPFEREKVWNTDAVTGCRRFLNRYFEMVHSEKVTEEENPEAMKLIYRLADAVIRDIEEMQFNTAIARMMEFLNDFTPLPAYPKKALKLAVQLLYPFAPHIGEELWQALGGTKTITYEPLPPIDSAYLVDDTTLYVVQVNGKLRARIEMAKDLDEHAVVKKAKEHPDVEKHLGTTILKTVFVPNKLLNLVVQ